MCRGDYPAAPWPQRCQHDPPESRRRAPGAGNTFYVDLEGHQQDATGGRRCASWRKSGLPENLGSYPAGTVRRRLRTFGTIEVKRVVPTTLQNQMKNASTAHPICAILRPPTHARSRLSAGQADRRPARELGIHPTRSSSSRPMKIRWGEPAGQAIQAAIADLARYPDATASS